MRLKTGLIAICTILVAGAAPVGAQSSDAEDVYVNRFLERTKKRHIRKLSWVAASFAVNGLSQADDYDRFAQYESAHFSNTSLSGLGSAKSFGLEMGLVFKERFAWSVGGEYWMQLGESQSGTFSYNPGTGDMTVNDLKSEIQVWGVSTGLQAYIHGHPSISEGISGLAFRVGGTVGYYQASWGVWSAYQNLNLSTSLSESANIDYQGTAPGFSFNLGGDYPLGWQELVLGADLCYQYLNFDNVAWYNLSDEEVVATYNGQESGRVDLDFSGLRGKFTVKRFFNW